MSMHGKTEGRMASKSQMARQDMIYHAEQMAQDAMRKTPQFKAAVKMAMHHLKEGEMAAQVAITKPPTKHKGMPAKAQRQAFKPMGKK